MKRILLMLLIILNINIVNAKETLVDHIVGLYENNEKSEAHYHAENDIIYRYAKNVGLMNDRLGGTTPSLDGGNLRYYGANPNNYIDIGDKYENDYTYVLANTETYNNFQTIEECQNYFSCSSNYAGMNPDGIEFDSEEHCYNYFAEDIAEPLFGIETTSNEDFINTYCKIETIPAGTPILWRIIGVFDGKVRIVRDEPIGAYSWDTSTPDINSGAGINQWGPSGEYKGAALMKLLNPGYEDNVDNTCNNCIWMSELGKFKCDCEDELININNSLWWNSESGTCYDGRFNSITPCDFTSIGLSESVKNKIVDQTIFLGGFRSPKIDVFVNELYQIERDNNVITNFNDDFNDNIARTTKWTGKVGLMYPSDYGYAVELNISACDTYMMYYDESGKEICKSNNWLYGKQRQHLITPYPYTTEATFSTDKIGDVSLNRSSDNNYVRPTLLLNSSLMLKSGTGTKEDPYMIGKENKYSATINYYGEDGKLLDIDNNPYILDNLSSGYTTTIKSPKVSGCYAKDVKVNITDKDEVYDVKYSCSVMVNPKTGRLFIILGIILGITSISYLLYYIKHKKEV